MIKYRNYILFSIEEDYSKYTGGRYEKYGTCSAERLRDEYLAPLLREALKDNKKVIIDIDGTLGLSTGFLEETFGGLLRHGFTYNELDTCLDFISAKHDVGVINLIYQLIDEELDRQENK